MEFINHDVIQPFSYDGPLDYVIHAAGIASPFYYRAYPLETLEVAITGTRNMLELAGARGARFTYFSSSEIYGDPDPKHVPMAESYRGNVSCQGPRPFNIFGPGMQETDYRVLPNFASHIKAGRPLKLYGSGAQTRTFCYITDAMIGFLKVVLKGVAGEAYNIGNPEPEISMLGLVDCIEGVIGKELARDVIEYPDSYPADEPMRRSPDITKARRQLGFAPSISLEDGLGRFLNWADGIYTGEL
jgi:UDP-glucuronate decarboxylase